MLSVLKQILSVAIFLFMAFLIGHTIYARFERPIREGLEVELAMDASGNSAPAPDESCDIKDASKPIELAAAFEKVNKQKDMIRTLMESTEPAVPLKIDKNGDPEYLVINNLKLLVNNGIEKNEASLKSLYDQYIGNREITLLTTELNSIQTTAPTAPTTATTATTAPTAPTADTAIIHGKEIGLMCRIKTVIDGHQTLLDRILEKKADE
jgi:hypothetical protein